MISEVLKDYILNKNLIEYVHYDTETLEKLDKVIKKNNINSLNNFLYVFKDDEFIEFFRDHFEESRIKYIDNLNFGDIYLKYPILYDMFNNIKNMNEEVKDIIYSESCEYIYIFCDDGDLISEMCEYFNK